MNDKKYEETIIDEQSYLSGGKNIFYKCMLCGDVLNSDPFGYSSNCKCLNIRIDTDAGRIAVRDYSNVRMLKLRN